MICPYCGSKWCGGGCPGGRQAMVDKPHSRQGEVFAPNPKPVVRLKTSTLVVACLAGLAMWIGFGLMMYWLLS